MNHLTNQEIAAVYAQYYGLKTGRQAPYDTVTGLMIDAIYRCDIALNLPLKPLATITPAHATEIAQLCWLGMKDINFSIVRRSDFAVWVKGIDSLDIRYHMCFNNYGGITTSATFPKNDTEDTITLDHTIGRVQLNCRDGAPYQMIYQYLMKQGYAVPLYFGPDHWANGKTALELEIAKQAEEVDNPLKTIKQMVIAELCGEYSLEESIRQVEEAEILVKDDIVNITYSNGVSENFVLITSKKLKHQPKEA